MRYPQRFAGLLLACMALLLTLPAPARESAFHPNLVADVAEQVAPSVVNIDTERQDTGMGLPSGLENHFRSFGFGFDSNSSQSPFRLFMTPGNTIENGNGSGIILDTAGHILTNNHVVDGTSKIMVTLQGGQKFPAQVLGRDPYSDLSILKVEAAPALLKPATLGSSTKLRPGEWVLAVGSPAGFDHTVTLGIISGISRRIPDLNRNMEYIQTDAAINPGNSGGPLVNLNGEVIGINTAISAKGQNIGFAIPIDIAKAITGTLISQGQVVRPYLGIAMATLDTPLAKSLGLPDNTTGVVISQVSPQSPAAQAGLRLGDVIQHIDGQPVSTAEAVQALVQNKPLNSAFNLQILRNGQMLGLSMTSAQLPDEAPRTPAYQGFQRR